MAAEQLQIQVQANVQQAISSLNNFNTQLNVTGNAVENLGTKSIEVLNNQLQRLQRLAQNPNLSTEQYQRLGKLINDTSKEADRLSKSLLILNRSNTQLSSGTGQASTALTNFGRVAQDAPFGLIGIANNIDPLIQSFVQLRKETGSGKAALAALGSSLTGGGGLILAVSLVTSALQFAQIGLDRWFGSTKKAKEETEKQKNATDNLRNAIDSVIQSYSNEIAQVTKLVSIAKDSSASTKLRSEAIAELNKIAPQYFKNLKQESDLTNQLTEAYNRYVKNIKTAIEIKILEKQLEANIEKQLKFNKESQKTIELQSSFIDIFKKQNTGLNAQGDQIRFINDQQNKFQRTQNKIASDGISIQIEQENILSQIVNLQKQLNQLDANNKSGEKTQKSIDLLKEYRLELKAISWNEVNRGIDGTVERLNLAESTLQSFLKQGVEPTRKEFVFITQEVEKFRAAYARVLASGRIELSIPKIQDKEVNKFAEGLKKLDTFKDAPGFVLVSLSKGLIKANEGAAKLGETFKAAEILRKNSEKNLKELTATIEGFVNPVIDNLFSALEQGEDPFKALIQSVKQLVFELGKAVVKSLVLKAIQTALAPQTSALPGGIGTAGFMPGVRFDQLRFAFFR